MFQIFMYKIIFIMQTHLSNKQSNNYFQIT